MRQIFTFLFIICIMTLTAAPVDQEVAARVAQNFYFERSNGGYLNITATYTLEEGSQALIYIFNGLPGQGFVMVSGDDRVYPVPGYSLNKSYNNDTSMQAPAFRLLMRNYTEQIRTHIDYSLPATPEAFSAWNHYNVSISLFSSQGLLSVPPLLGPIEWGQGCYYNADCPYDTAAGAGLCNHVPVGCVATSLCMIMKYWNYPTQGAGSKSYTHSTYGFQSANFGTTSYDWNLMPAVVTGPNPEVAKLCYHAGVSVEMDYGPTGSGAYTSDVRLAMINNFGYDTVAHYELKDYYTNQQWEMMLRNELDSMKPVIYRGSNFGGTGGHAWVIDGYQGTSGNHFHCNWGWNGYHNGYFYLSSLTPASYTFTFNQGSIMGLVPLIVLPPAADFTANITTVGIGSNVQFTDLSTGNPFHWQWDFGDGDSSTVKNPLHSYSLAGQYTVELIAHNVAGTDTVTKTNYITVVVPPAPVADFTGNPQVVQTGSPVQFTDLSANFPVQWMWDFGDGQSGNVQNPQHTYQTPGLYSVKLVVSNNNGSDSITKTDYITVNPPPPQADFSAGPLFAYTGDTIYFTDLSTDNPTSWHWQFGDGDTSDLQNPWHIFTMPGGYSITLKVENQFGYAEMTKPHYIYVMPAQPAPLAWFAGTPTTILTGESVDFHDYSAGNPVQWEWTFSGGDPATSNLQNPGLVRYDNPGSYDVKLVVWNSSGNHELIRNDYITVGVIGVDEPDRKDIRVFPIPADETLNIVSENPVDAVRVFDITGRLVLQFKMNQYQGDNPALNVEAIPPGVYYLEITSGEKKHAIKTLIAR